MNSREYEQQRRLLADRAKKLEAVVEECLNTVRAVRALLDHGGAAEEPDGGEDSYDSAEEMFTAAAQLVSDAGLEPSEITVVLHDGQTEENMPAAVREMIERNFPGARISFERAGDDANTGWLREKLQEFTGGGYHGRHERPGDASRFDPNMN